MDECIQKAVFNVTMCLCHMTLQTGGVGLCYEIVIYLVAASIDQAYGTWMCLGGQ